MTSLLISSEHRLRSVVKFIADIIKGLIKLSTAVLVATWFIFRDNTFHIFVPKRLFGIVGSRNRRRIISSLEFVSKHYHNWSKITSFRSDWSKLNPRLPFLFEDAACQTCSPAYCIVSLNGHSEVNNVTGPVTELSNWPLGPEHRASSCWEQMMLVRRRGFFIDKDRRPRAPHLYNDDRNSAKPNRK